MQRCEQAVSPVIGVMLMLVVVIIIAAIVSAFSGSAVSGTQKAPTAVVQATYSQSGGMTMTNSGGDAIPLASTTVLVRPSRSFGDSATRYSWVVNKTYILSSTGQNWVTAKAFKPGDTATISMNNLSYVQQRPDMTTDILSSDYGFNSTNNLGLSFELQFQDSAGKTIGQNTVTIAT